MRAIDAFRQIILTLENGLVLTFCDPRDANNYHWEVRDRRHLDWHAAMKYVRLVAESSDYFEGEDYEPVVVSSPTEALGNAPSFSLKSLVKTPGRPIPTTPTSAVSYRSPSFTASHT